VKRHLDDDDKYELQAIDRFNPADRDLLLVEVLETISGTYSVVQPNPAGHPRPAAAIDSAHLLHFSLLIWTPGMARI
jgi:hypothetical protein